MLWNDSADPVSWASRSRGGAVGATCNPVIAVTCVKADLPRWQGRMREIAATRPTATESQIGWQVVEEVSLEAARMLEPAFARHQGRNGRLSMQTDPRLHRDATALADQAVYFSGLAKNIIVKIPRPRPACGPSRTPPPVGSASMSPCPSPFHRPWRPPRRSNEGSPRGSGPARTPRIWVRS